MKKMVLIATLFVSASQAQDAAQMKQLALDGCKTAAAHQQGALKDQVLKSCECTVKNTDYDKLLKLQAEGNMQELHHMTVKAAQKCAAEAM